MGLFLLDKITLCITIKQQRSDILGNYVLYLDESVSNKKIEGIKYKVLTVGGCIVKNEKVNEIDHEINCIKDKIWYGFDEPENNIFHSVQIYRAIFGRNIYKFKYNEVFKLHKNQTFLFNGIKKIFDDDEIIIIAASGCLNDLEKNYKQEYSEAYVGLFERILENYAHFLIKENSKGTVVIEESSLADGILKKFFRVKSRGTLHINRKTIQPRLDSIKIISKYDNNNLLQLSDIVAYTLSRNAVGKENLKPGVYKNIRKILYDGKIGRSDLFGHTIYKVTNFKKRALDK